MHAVNLSSFSSQFFSRSRKLLLNRTFKLQRFYRFLFLKGVELFFIFVQSRKSTNFLPINYINRVTANPYHAVYMPLTMAVNLHLQHRRKGNQIRICHVSSSEVLPQQWILNVHYYFFCK